MPEKPRTMNRRRFVTLAALGGAAALAAPLGAARAAGAASAAPGAKPRAAGRKEAAAAIRREIANQERSLAKTLATIRSYELPPGSPMAFVFAPLRSRRRGR
jgi:hypothetical protein